MMCNKYKITGEKLDFNGIVLHRIEALNDFGDVKKGDKGGWIEKESNLSQDGDCWVYGNAKVCDKARVCENALVRDNVKVCDKAWVCGNAEVSDTAWVCSNAEVSGNAVVCGNALVSGDAVVSGNAVVHGNALVSGDAVVSGNAEVCDNAVVNANAEISGDAVIEKIGDYLVFQNWWSSGRFFTYTKSNKMWKVGCFYGTGEELINKAYADYEEKGKMYEKIVKLVKE